MKLKDLLFEIKFDSAQEEALQQEVCGITTDHRKVKKGSVFIALKGQNFDGNDFIIDAIEKGAVAVISENNPEGENFIHVENARSAYALMSKHFYNDVCDRLKIIAITGTNGKTTTTNIIANILRSNGKKVGVIGTLGAQIGDDVVDTGMTTPDPDKLHALFQKMYENGIEYVVMEASAHALALHKLDGIVFEVGVLTNISEDHLDFFEDMEKYAKAKFKLFEAGRVKKGVVCKGKVFDDVLLEKMQVPYITYSADSKENAYVRADKISLRIDGSTFLMFCGREAINIEFPLAGLYNIENLLASACVCTSLGLNLPQIRQGAKATLPVEGRFNVFNINGTHIIIDFAHTPDGLEKVLLAAKGLSEGKIVVVFGCGGNRDRLKRPIMGEIASRLADEVVLTSDNPRFENPYDIITEISKGLVSQNVVIIADRKKAIEYALEKYNHGETIIIAGKGGEKYQDINGVKYPYSDFDVVSGFFRRKVMTESSQGQSEDDGDYLE